MGCEHDGGEAGFKVQMDHKFIGRGSRRRDEIYGHRYPTLRTLRPRATRDHSRTPRGRPRNRRSLLSTWGIRSYPQQEHRDFSITGVALIHGSRVLAMLLVLLVIRKRARDSAHAFSYSAPLLRWLSLCFVFYSVGDPACTRQPYSIALTRRFVNLAELDTPW
jgi:hypothetical protein